MARYRSKQELEDIEMKRHVRTVVGTLQEDIAALGKSWGDAIPDDYSKQIYALIKQSAILQQVPEASYMRHNVAMLANEELAKPYSQLRIQRKQAQEKQRIAAFTESAKGRPVVDEGVGAHIAPGTIVRSRNQLLMCVSCEFLPSTPGEDGDDAAWLTKYAEPTEQEKQSEQYLSAKKSLDIELAYNETLRKNAKILLERNEW